MVRSPVRGLFQTEEWERTIVGLLQTVGEMRVSVMEKKRGGGGGLCGKQSPSQRGGSFSAQLCVLAGCEKLLPSCQHRKPTGRDCARLRWGRQGTEAATDRGLKDFVEFLNLKFQASF